MRPIYTLTLFLVATSTCFAESLLHDAVATDSVEKPKPRSYSYRVIARVNSAGFFNFTGRICSRNPAADLTFTVEKNGWGFTWINVKDLVTKSTENNFSFPIIYKKIAIGKQFMVTPHVGYVIRPWASEYGERLIVITSFRPSKHVTLEETALLANIVHKNDHEWVNRFRILYGYNEHLQLIYSFWHNNHVLDTQDYLSTSLHLGYNHVPMSKHASLNLAVGYLYMAKSSDEVNAPLTNGFILTLGCQFN